MSPSPTSAGNPDQPYTIVPAPPLAYSTLGMVVSLVALVALLVAMVAVALCYRHRQKGKENRHLAVAYTAGRMDTSEYVVPEHPQEGLRASGSSLASENPYATIKDVPSPPAKAPEGSYMEMKSPVQREMSYAEIGLLEEPNEEESSPGGAEGAAPVPNVPSHYDSPKNSHIPCHYDVPPVRHPPSPPLRRKDR
ncbi:hypothetical protein ASZ78_003344 [Callipepla squamata]|uniref:Uncharacterized protein n=1 Tax=Callipepla squamata TaxID=9009 RepID=A0A226M904_CALSU|nr:hypothetical protein ASZ78_003344 [Callipepla squamata]